MPAELILTCDICRQPAKRCEAWFVIVEQDGELVLVSRSDQRWDVVRFMVGVHLCEEHFEGLTATCRAWLDEQARDGGSASGGSKTGKADA